MRERVEACHGELSAGPTGGGRQPGLFGSTHLMVSLAARELDGLKYLLPA